MIYERDNYLDWLSLGVDTIFFEKKEEEEEKKTKLASNLEVGFVPSYYHHHPNLNQKKRKRTRGKKKEYDDLGTQLSTIKSGEELLLLPF